MRTLKAALIAALTPLAAIATGTFAAPAAQAAVTYSEVTSFGAARVHEPVGVAVDQATGDVYTGSFFIEGKPPLDKFDAAGSILPPSPFGEGDRAFFGAYFFSGVAVDPANSDLYALDGTAEEIQTYSASGEPISHFSVAGSANVFGLLTAVQIASDAAGNIYFPNAPNNEVQEFNPQGGLVATFTGSGEEALKEPTGVAVDASGNVYVADNGNGRMEEFGPTGAFIMAIGAGVNKTTSGEVCTAASGNTCGPGSEGVQSVALGAGGEIFLGEKGGAGFHVGLYSGAGEKLSDFGLGTIGTSGFETISTLAVGPNGAVYVADAGHSLVRVYAQQSRPSIVSASAQPQHFTAILKASIATGLAETAYRFEYGPTNAYGASVPVPDQDIGNGLDGPVTVARQLTGLQAGTTYHYRVAASNALGQTAGPDQTFTTLPPRPPIVATGQASGVAENSVTLTGTIDTQGSETTYEFDIGVDTSYGTRLFADAGLEAGARQYAFPLQGLMPGTTYHYRIAATNLFGTTYGIDQTFTTTSYPGEALTPPPTSLAQLPTSLLVPTGATSAPAKGTTKARVVAHAARRARSRAGHRRRRAAMRKHRRTRGGSGHVHSGRRSG